MGDGTIPSVDLLGGEIRVVNDRSQSDQSSPTCGCCGQRESEDESDQRELNTKLHLALDQMVGRSERLLRQAQPQIVVKLNIWDQEFRLSIYWQIGVMIARLFFKQPIKLRCCPLLRQRKIENIREMTTKIDTKCGLESKMLSGILNGGVKSLQVRVKIQTLF